MFSSAYMIYFIILSISFSANEMNIYSLAKLFIYILFVLKFYLMFVLLLFFFFAFRMQITLIKTQRKAENKNHVICQKLINI